MGACAARIYLLALNFLEYQLCLGISHLIPWQDSSSSLIARWAEADRSATTNKQLFQSVDSMAERFVRDVKVQLDLLKLHGVVVKVKPSHPNQFLWRTLRAVIQAWMRYDKVIRRIFGYSSYRLW